MERFIYESREVGGRARFKDGFGDEQPLTLFIRSLVGLDPRAAKAAFADCIGEQQLDSRQIKFVEMIVEHLTQQGTMRPKKLYEPPFTRLHDHGLEGIFTDDNVDTVIQIVRAVNRNAEVAKRVA